MVKGKKNLVDMSTTNKLLIGIIFNFILAPLCMANPNSYYKNDPVSPAPERMSAVELKNLARLKNSSFLNDIEGTKIASGQKSFVISPGASAPVMDQSFRRALSAKTSLYLESEGGGNLSLNAGLRGLPPNGTTYSQVLVDGIPVQTDLLGKMLTYYFPHIQSIKEIQFYSGQSSVLFGPNHGGAINVITYTPAGDQPLRFTTLNAFGSDNQFSTYSLAEGTEGIMSYSLNAYYRQGAGNRASAAFSSQAVALKYILSSGDGSKWTFAYTPYSDFAREPGFLTLAEYEANPEFSPNGNDFLSIQRHPLSLTLEKKFTSESLLEWRNWFTYLDRLSIRQSIARVERQEFYTGGSEARFLRQYDAFGQSGHTLAFGAFVQYTDTPYTLDDINTGAQIARQSRYNSSLAFFIQNQFQITDQWTITPGLRLENVWQGVDGQVLGTQTTRDYSESIPLFNVGTEYILIEGFTQALTPLTLYGNVSRTYRAPTLDDGFNSPANVSFSPGLSAGIGYHVEAGLRGHPVEWFTYDLGGFWSDIGNQPGIFNNEVINEGRTEYAGIELFQSTELIGLFEWITQRVHPGESSQHELNFYTAFSTLEARILSTPFAGNAGARPAYTPDYTLRIGIEYHFAQRYKIGFQSALTAAASGNNNKSLIAPGISPIPSSWVSDVYFEAYLPGDVLSIFGSINNLFDEEYYSLNRATTPAGAIDPVPGREFLVGMKLEF